MQRAIVQEGRASKKVELVKEICEYVKKDPVSKITLNDLGERFGVSPYHLQRIFKDVMGISPRKYIEECRISVLKLRLARGDSVLEALRGTGYTSQSWLYGNSRVRLGMTPATYRKGGSGSSIVYSIGDSSLGRLLVAATDHGICSISMGTNDRDLIEALRIEFPRANITKSERARRYLDGVQRHLSGQEVKLPLDVRGTDFQRRVWAALQLIPLGETRTYSQVAAMINEPKAIRAVANACASNPIPLIVPCHRVIRRDGTLGGYRFGMVLKRALLQTEQAQAIKRQTR
jgi:AraC family transcriptional regulator of adaptative response/methylated-DNA-[protein]-cysteine methyltransferase